MRFQLSPQMCEAAYEFWRSAPPFRRWKLPPSDEIQFHVIHKRGLFADCEMVDGEHIIRISTAKVRDTYALVDTMAHEMVHVYLDRRGVRAHHGADFKRCAARVCRIHGFDPKTF